jgi:TPR repeat protein
MKRRLLFLASSLLFTQAYAVELKQFDRSTYSQAVTECDRLTAHADDPNSVAPGVVEANVDIKKAIEVCQADLAKDPNNPRLMYQLARSLVYGGRTAEGLKHIDKSAELKYPQALFVSSLLYLDGLYGAPKDVCRAARLIRESAIYGRLAGQVGYPARVIEGRFDECSPKPDYDELVVFLNAVLASKPDYYKTLLAESLLRELAAKRNGKR